MTNPLITELVRQLKQPLPMELTPDEVRLIEDQRAQAAMKEGRAPLEIGLKVWMEHVLEDLRAEVEGFYFASIEETLVGMRAAIDRRLDALNRGKLMPKLEKP